MSRITAIPALVMLLAVVACASPPIEDDGGDPGPSTSNVSKSKSKAKADAAPEVDSTPTTSTRTEPTSPTAPLTCSTDAQCNSSSRICESGHCVKGTRTDAGTTPSTTLQCVDDFDCVLGKICTQNKCVSGCHNDFDCPLEDVCGFNGQCVLDTTTSSPSNFECIIDGDCNPGNDGSGKICSAFNQCIPGCHQDNQCPGVTICIGGNCL